MNHISIELLGLTNYRNYDRLKVAFGSGLNLITGMNGAGKTTILDAIYYLCNGKSFFTHLDRHIYKTNQEFFRITGQFLKAEANLDMTIVSSLGKKKTLSIDEKPLKSIVELMGVIPAFAIAPKDILILLDSSQARRRLLDKTISHSDKHYLHNLLKYNKTLKLRNAYLKEASKKGISDSTYLDSLDVSLAEPARYIYKARSEHISALITQFEVLYKQLSDDKESVSLEYTSQLSDTTLVQLLKTDLRKDLITAKTNSGIHKDDLYISIDGQAIKKYGSQGQLKTAIIALKLAQMQWMESITSVVSILLLDDIFDKLDRQRVKQLLAKVCQEGRQVFISDTDNERLLPIFGELNLEYNQLIIADGTVSNG